MFTREGRRLPSPALVVSMVALGVALGGTGFAATRGVHVDSRQDTKLVNQLAPTLTVKHAATADSATNANKLGGLDASGYVTNDGAIVINVGSSNWRSLDSTDPIKWTYLANATQATSTGAGTYYLTAHPTIPTMLYGWALNATAFTLCYSASASAKIARVEVKVSTYANDGYGTVHIAVSDSTNRTDGACRTYAFTAPVTLTSLDDIAVVIRCTYSAAATLTIGQSHFLLTPKAA